MALTRPLILKDFERLASTRPRRVKPNALEHDEKAQADSLSCLRHKNF